MSFVMKGGSFGEFGPGDLHMLLLRLKDKEKDKIKVMQAHLQSIAHSQNMEAEFFTAALVYSTSKTSSSVCLHQPHLFSPGLHQMARTNACERWLGLPAGSWVIPV